MDMRGLLIIALMLVCVAAYSQEPKLILRQYSAGDADVLVQDGRPYTGER